MPVQAYNDYSANHAAAYEGQKVELGNHSIISKACEEANGIAFGLAVVKGTLDSQCKLPAGAGGVFFGISQYTSAWGENTSGLHLYQQYREVNIIEFGRVWVKVEEAVAYGDPVFFRHTAAGAEVLGAFRKSDDDGDADRVEGAIFESTAAIGGLAIVNLGLKPKSVFSSNIQTATSGAISLLTDVTFFDSTLGASTATLADGYEGQEKILKMTVDGGDQVVTPANFFDGTTITFGDVNDVVKLKFLSGNWHVISNVGAVIA